MDKQNQWNLDMWKRENAYNSPKQQIERLKEAGLNPDMLYGQGQVQNVGAVGPRSSQGSTPVQADISSYVHGMGSAIRQGLENTLLKSQIDNVDANTKKTLGESDILATESEFKRALLQNEVALGNVQIKVADKSLKLTDAQISNLYQITKNAEQELNNLQATYQTQLAQAKLLDAQGERQLIENMYAQVRESQELREIMARANLTEQQAKMTVELMAAQIFNLKQQGKLNLELRNESIENQSKIHAVINQVIATTDSIKLQTELDSKYADAERIIGIAEKIPSLIAKMIGGFTFK